MNPESAAAARNQGAGKSRRLYKNFFVKPKHQMAYPYYVICVGFAVFGTTAVLIQRKMTQIAELLNQGPDSAVSYLQLTDLFADATRFAMFGFFGFVLFSCIYALVISHRVSGPMTAIIAFIEQLQKGNYDYRRELRRRDELKPILGALKNLAAALRKAET
jgi:nitrogen fixation/metabolism regulation signal transduction histidine kinase